MQSESCWKFPEELKENCSFSLKEAFIKEPVFPTYYNFVFAIELAKTTPRKSKTSGREFCSSEKNQKFDITEVDIVDKPLLSLER